TRHAHMLGAMRAVLEGRFADAERCAAAAEALSSELGDPNASWILDVHRAITSFVATRPIDARLKETISNYPPGRAAIVASVATQEGAEEAARIALGELGTRIPNDPDLAAMVANATAYAGSDELATAVYDAIAPRAGGIVLASMVGCNVFDLNDRLLLLLAS